MGAPKARPKREKDGRGRLVVTTGVAAKALGVSTHAVSTWCDCGILECYRVPGTTGREQRRIVWDDVLAFAERYPEHARLLRDYAGATGMPLEPAPSARTLTVPEAARYLGCAEGTVVKWCDAGTLECYRLPRADGTPGDRRILASTARAFAEQHGIPVTALRDEPPP